MPQLRLQLLGAFQTYLDDMSLVGYRSDKSRALLAYLAAESDRVHRRESLASLFWGGYNERSARRSLSSALTNLRILLAPLTSADSQTPLLTTNWHEASFTADPELAFIDVLEFDRLLTTAAAHQHRSMAHCAACIERLRQAAELYRGPFLAGMSLPDAPEFDAWQTQRAQHYEQQALLALNTLTHHHIVAGDLRNAERYARQQIDIDNLREAAYRQLMTVLAAAGQRPAALAQYEACRQILRSELGVEPDEETTALYEELQAGGLNRQVAMAANLLENPYKGLKPFLVGDAADYYGRDVISSYLVDVLNRSATVGVVGPSGSGKTSLIHAGLLHQLIEDSHRASSGGAATDVQPPWLICQVRPGPSPLRSLEAGLAQALSTAGPVTVSELPCCDELSEELRKGRVSLRALFEQTLLIGSRRVLIVCDQFEELFTLCQDAAEQAAFLDVLSANGNSTEPADWLRVLVTLRADFMGQLLSHRPMADALQGSTVILGPMNDAELETAIVQPARAQGVEFQDGLVARLLGDVGGEAGRLPLLQFCLMQLWDHQRNRQLTHQDYDAIGGVEGALTRYADDLYATLADEDKQAVRRVLTQMVRPGVDREDTRRPITRGHLSAADWATVQRLADARLVVTDRDSSGQEVAEIAHEALIQRWGLLRDWIDTDRAFYLWHQRTRLAAAQWVRTGRDPGALLRGAPLAEALDWTTNKPSESGPDVAEFVAASQTQRDQEQAEKNARQERELQQAQTLTELEHQRFEFEARSNRRLRWLVAGLAVVTVLALLGGLAAWSLQRVASQQAEHALSRQLAAQAINLTDTQLDLAMLLNDEALRRSTPEDRHDLLLNLNVSPLIETHLYGHKAAVFAMVLSSDGQIMASGTDDGAITLWDLTEERTLAELPGEPGVNTISLAFSPDDHVLASGDSTGIVHLWDVASGTSLGEMVGHTQPVNALAFSEDGQTLRSISDDGTSRLWDLTTQQEVTDGLLPLTSRKGMAISLAGNEVAGKLDTGIIVQDLATGEEVSPPLLGHSAFIHQMQFSPDGSLLASASFDSQVILWNLKTGQPLHPPLEGHEGRALAVAFSPDGKILATGGTDGKIFLWNVSTGTRLAVPDMGHGNWVRVLRFTPDGQRLISGDADGTILVWDMNLFRQLMGHENTVRALDFSPDGHTLASGSFDGSVRRWDLVTGKPVGEPMKGHANSVIAVNYSPDGKLLVSGSAGGDTVFWDANTGQQLAPAIKAHDDAILNFAFSPDGQTLASVGFDGIINLWDVASMEPRGQPLTGHEGWTMAVAFSPDGKLLASTGADATLRFWDAATGEPLGMVPTGHAAWVTTLAFSPDGKTVATGSIDETVRLWDVETMQPLGEPLTGHEAGVWFVAFNPADNGQTLVSSDGSGAIIVWDVATREPLAPPLHGDMETERFALSPDGSEVAIANFANTGTISLWQLGPVIAQKWEDRACRIANRDLTEEEWQHYMGDLPYQATCSGR